MVITDLEATFLREVRKRPDAQKMLESAVQGMQLQPKMPRERTLSEQYYEKAKEFHRRAIGYEQIGDVLSRCNEDEELNDVSRNILREALWNDRAGDPRNIPMAQAPEGLGRGLF